MANIKINELPLFTGSTSGITLVMNDSTESTTHKITKEKLNEGLISGSSQISFGGLSNVPSGLVSGSSQILNGSGIWSGSSQLPSGVVSGSAQVLNGSGLWSGSAQLPSGVISGSAQLPSSIVSSSAQITTFGFATTGSNTFRGTETISGSLLVSGSAQLAGSFSIQSGSITMPNRPAFRVVGVSSADRATPLILSGSAVSVDYNEGGHFNTTNGKFTAPIAGLYQVYFNGRVGSINSSMQVIVYKNTNISSLMWETTSNVGASHFGVSGILKLAVNDTLEVKVTVGSIQFDANDNFGVSYIG